VNRLELGFDSDLGNVSLAAAAVSSACLCFGLDRATANQVELCTVEGVTNAIQHAYHGQPGKLVSVIVTSETDRVRLEIVDSGTPMPAECIKRLLNGSDVFQICDTERASLAETGRGLQIMHDLMDAVAYTPGGSFNRSLPGSGRAGMSTCRTLRRSPPHLLPKS
jgi:anti-sigma regulatory factor (Ser/Thr protein kinase)